MLWGQAGLCRLQGQINKTCIQSVSNALSLRKRHSPAFARNLAACGIKATKIAAEHPYSPNQGMKPNPPEPLLPPWRGDCAWCVQSGQVCPAIMRSNQTPSKKTEPESSTCVPDLSRMRHLEGAHLRLMFSPGLKRKNLFLKHQQKKMPTNSER